MFNLARSGSTQKGRIMYTTKKNHTKLQSGKRAYLEVCK